MPKVAKKTAAGPKKVLVSLPQSLVVELNKYAAVCRGGNKSGFVADAVEAYIKGLRKHRIKQKSRESYRESAKESLAIAQEWESLDDEAWSQIDQLEVGRK